MPREMPTKGYDPVLLYSWQEIKAMYIKDGWDLKKAEEQAKIVAQNINTLNVAEQRLWNKVRKHETLIPDMDTFPDQNLFGEIRK